MESRESFSVFSDGAERSPHLLPLKKSHAKVTTVTGVTKVLETAEGTPYYKKSQSEDLEYNQLQFLQRIGLPVPNDVLRNIHTRESVTSSAGAPLGEVLKTAENGKNDLLSKAGKVLREVHEVVQDVIIPDEVLSLTYENTAHIVDCFFYKYPGSDKRVSVASYRRHKLSIRPEAMIENSQAQNETADFIPFDEKYHPHLQIMINVANGVAKRYKEDLIPYVENKREAGGEQADYLVIPDQSICYGDFKDENLLVNAAGDVTLIDPLLSKGSSYFDIAKFTSRQLIDAAEAGTEMNLKPFFDGYELLPTEDMRVYGPFTFSDLVCLDLLNISKSYLKRYAASKKEYRMTAAFDSPDFCLLIASLLVDLYSVQDTSQLENLLFVEGN